MHPLRLTTVLLSVLLAACSRITPSAPPVDGKATILDVSEDGGPPPSITEQVEEAERRREAEHEAP